MNRSEGRRERITPRRTFVVALFTLAAAVTSFFAALLADRLADLPLVRHLLWHLLWALLVLPIAFGLHRFRSARPATGWTERCLAAADLLVRNSGTLVDPPKVAIDPHRAAIVPQGGVD
ncbi:MAG TPA: hypothetical protein VGU71_09975 [Candidatus Dormibacteraeota bacterium]|nr:hypothetical protein [Candidatus Dormibacteraeota bacterium]